MSVSDTSLHTSNLTLEPADNERLANLCGALDAHIRQIELALGIEIKTVEMYFRIIGPVETVAVAENLISSLYENTQNNVLSPSEVHLFLQEAGIEGPENVQNIHDVSIKTRRNIIRGRSPNQNDTYTIY